MGQPNRKSSDASLYFALFKKRWIWNILSYKWANIPMSRWINFIIWKIHSFLFSNWPSFCIVRNSRFPMCYCIKGCLVSNPYQLTVKMWKARIFFILLIFFFLPSVNAGYNAIDDCIKTNTQNKKKPSIPPSSCHDSEAGLCAALFQLDAQTIGTNLME